jgi:hypothetical protein
MRQFTDGVHWRGIGAPDDTRNVERSEFARTVRDAVTQTTGRSFERLRGGSAMTRGPGASGWHIFNVALPQVVDAPLVEVPSGP